MNNTSMKRLLILLVFVSSLCNAQQITWQKYFGAAFISNQGGGIVQEPDSGFMISANMYIGSQSSILLIRTDKYGDTLWTKQHFGFRPEKTIKTLDSGYAIAAKIPSLTGVLILKLNSIGDTLWTKQYYPGSFYGGHDICETHDNGFVIGTQGSFFKVDKSVNFQWDVYMGYCAAVKKGFNGDIIASGSTCNNPDIYSVDCVDSMGAVIWNRTYGNISNTSDWWAVSDFVFLPDSNIMAVCQYQTGGWHLMKIGYATGDTIFTNLAPVPGLNYINSMVTTMDGNIAIGMDYFLLKVDTQGNTIWVKTMSCSTNELTGCSDGGIALAGLTYPSPPQSVVTYAKSDSLGNIYNFQGINNLYSNGEAWVYPNPVTTTTATVQFKNPQQQHVTLTVYDVLGNVVMQKETTGNSFTIHAAVLKNGMYFFTLNASDALHSGKFVVE